MALWPQPVLPVQPVKAYTILSRIQNPSAIEAMMTVSLAQLAAAEQSMIRVPAHTVQSHVIHANCATCPDQPQADTVTPFLHAASICLTVAAPSSLQALLEVPF